MKNLTQLAGPRGLLHRGDLLVWDRWKWLSSKLESAPQRILDAGCGNGSLAINMATLGHSVVGLSWSAQDVAFAERWASLFNVSNVGFEVVDLKHLDKQPETGALRFDFDVVTCTEVIEHIVEDAKLLKDLRARLRRGGTLLLTTPYYGLKPMFGDDMHPEEIEDGRHVRRGYTSAQLRQLLSNADFNVVAIEGCSGARSQHTTSLQRRIHHASGTAYLAWAVSLPSRLTTTWMRTAVPLTGPRPAYSVCVVATAV